MVSDVDKAEPFVLRRPPDRGTSRRRRDEVDTVVAEGVADRVRHRLLLLLAVESRGDVRVAKKAFHANRTSGHERSGDALEGAATVSQVRQVHQRAVRAVDQASRLVEVRRATRPGAGQAERPRRFRARLACLSIAGEVSMPMTRLPFA